MIDDQPPAGLGGRVDLDARQPTGEMGGPAGNKVEAPAPERVGQLVPKDGVEAGIAEHDLGRGPGRGILVAVGLDQFARDAVEPRVEELRRALRVARRRKPTKPTKAATERRLREKRRRGELKRLRRPP